MDALAIIPFLIFLVIIFTAIAERINVPYPLLLVVVGLVVGFIPRVPNWHPPSNLVLPLFLPPILFAAARLISWQDIKNNGLEIIVLSIILVITSSIGMALSLNSLFPLFTIGSTFVLGAIISPTDSISATSILKKMNTKQRLVRTLEIESLFNDAVSITLYNIAVFLVFTGAINTASFFQEMLPAAFGGIAVGMTLSFFTSVIVDNFLKESENELPIIMSLILAYISYLFAERIGASGVLSVVAAGLFHTKTERSLKASTRLAEQASWNTFIFFLNGVIFMVIGLQFPAYLKKVRAIPNLDLLAFSSITIVLLLGFRIFWVVILRLLRRLMAKLKMTSKNASVYSWRDMIISACSGMRGMVSLALAIALPLEIAPSIPFPNRDLIIFLTIIVIIFTVVVQGIALPFIIKALDLEEHAKIIQEQSNHIYELITQKAIARISQLEQANMLTAGFAKQLIDNYYATRLLQFNIAKESELEPCEVGIETAKWLSGFLQYERELLHDLLKQGKINQEVYLQIMCKIDRDEVSFSALS